MITLTTLEICRAWASGLAHNRTFQALAGVGATWRVRIGADMLKPPTEKDAPFVVLFPDGRAETAEGGVREIGVLVGIVDDGWIDTDGVAELAGLARLAELDAVLLEALRQAIPMPVSGWTVEYDIINFPLLTLNCAATVETVASSR